MTLRCRASPAVQISVQCASEWVSPSQQHNEDIRDPDTGRSYLQTSVDITRDMVDGGFSADDDYQCQCHAWNNMPGVKPLLTRSRTATFHVACEYYSLLHSYIYG